MRVLITGASSGIGRQLALDYLKQGCIVFCCGRDAERLKEICDRFPSNASALVFDIQDQGATARALSSCGPLELAILNAGTCEYIDAEQFDAALFKRVVDTNLIGLANCIAPLVDALRPGGRLALMGSSASYVPLPRAEAYGASKAAVEYLARTLAISLRPRRIGISYIAPGFVDTPLTQRNRFRMPMIIDGQTASAEIRKGLAAGKAEIHFPRRFTLILKFLAHLPAGLQRALIGRAVLES